MGILSGRRKRKGLHDNSPELKARRAAMKVHANALMMSALKEPERILREICPPQLPKEIGRAHV